MDSTSGMTVLVRGRILSHGAVALPTEAADGERVAQIVAAEIGGIRVLAINLHLTYLPGRDDLRRAELEALAARLPPPDGFDLALMAGDFNCTPDSAPVGWLMRDSGLDAIDLCAAAGNPFPTHGESASGHPAGKRIDYVFALGGTARRFAAAATPAFAEADPATGDHPSDHLGIRVALQPARAG